MAYIYYNPNPVRKIVGDCVIRAICKLTNKDWRTIFLDVCSEGMQMYDMPSSNAVWGNYLTKIGFRRHAIRSDCYECYTVSEFCIDYPSGKYLLATGTHAVAVVDGNYYDTWDSGNENPIYYWTE